MVILIVIMLIPILSFFILFLYCTNISTCISAHISANPIKTNSITRWHFITHKHGYKVTLVLFQAIILHQVVLQ